MRRSFRQKQKRSRQANNTETITPKVDKKSCQIKQIIDFKRGVKKSNMDSVNDTSLPCPPPYQISVIGLGAMGGGIARNLLHSNICQTIIGYDVSQSLVDTFYNETIIMNKQYSKTSPTTSSLSDSISNQTQFVILVLQNEIQCELICFGNIGVNNNNIVNDTNNTSNNTQNNKNDINVINLLTLLSKNSCVILCSTVSPTWATKASCIFEENNIYFIDCPISGGPIRARDGELTLLSSANEISYNAILKNEYTKSIFEVMSKKDQWYIIEGNAGNGSMVKMVHQLLAGVHIVVAAEALALAAKAGLDVYQFYNIVNGAAGASWMFNDRGLRMMETDDNVEVRSYLEIFIKDLDIVYQEAKKLNSPIPIALTALQQFMNAASLGYNRYDDSYVKKCYEQITGVPIQKSNNDKIIIEKELDKVLDISPTGKVDTNEYWVMDDGTNEVIVEVGNEPRHHIILQNKYIRAIRVQFPPNDTTLAHKHLQDSIYFFLVPDGLNVINHVKGLQPICDCFGYGEVRYGAHKSEQPLIHKITNQSNTMMHCIDAEILCQPPIISPIPLIAQYHECIKIRSNCRIYKLTLLPGQYVETNYIFFHCTVVIQGSTIKKSIPSNSGSDRSSTITWTEEYNIGDFDWKEPIMNIQKTNVGTTTYIEYIAEWM